MANAAKKATSADVKDNAVQAPAEVKAEVKTEAAAPKTEKNTEAKKPGRKPAAKKETAAKADKKPAAKKEAAKTEKKPAAKKETAKTEKKPAAAKSSAPKTSKKTEAAKPAAKRGRPAAAKNEEKAAPAKRVSKKKQLSYEEIVDAARKKAMAANVTNVKVHIAANVVLTGNFSENGNDNESKNQFYIEINPETESINVQPYRYEENTFEISADAEELFKVLKGKKNIYDALSDGDFHIHGKTKPAVLFIHAVF